MGQSSTQGSLGSFGVVSLLGKNFTKWPIGFSLLSFYPQRPFLKIEIGTH